MSEKILACDNDDCMKKDEVRQKNQMIGLYKNNNSYKLSFVNIKQKIEGLL